MRNQEMEPMNVYGADYNHPLPNLLILTYKPFTPFADYNWSVYIYIYIYIYIYVSLLLLVSVSPLLLISIKALKINTLQYTKNKIIFINKRRYNKKQKTKQLLLILIKPTWLLSHCPDRLAAVVSERKVCRHQPFPTKDRIQSISTVLNVATPAHALRVALMPQL